MMLPSHKYQSQVPLVHVKEMINTIVLSLHGVLDFTGCLRERKDGRDTDCRSSQAFRAERRIERVFP